MRTDAAGTVSSLRISFAVYKEGYVAAVANVAPPPARAAAVVSLDVEATLRPEMKR